MGAVVTQKSESREEAPEKLDVRKRLCFQNKCTLDTSH